MAKTYFISFNAVDYSEFFPSNRPETTYKKESGEMFLRYSIDDFSIPRTTNKTIYDTLESYFFDDTKFGTTLNFKIKKSGVDKYLFRMSVNEGQIDSEKRVFTCSPRTNDDYQDIIDLYDIKWQDRAEGGLFGLAEQFYSPIIETNLFINVDFDIFGDAAHAVNWTNSSPVTTEKARNALSVVPDDNTTVTFIVDNFAGDVFSLRLVNQAFAQVSTAILAVNADGVYTLTKNGGATTVYVEMFVLSGPGVVSGTFDYEIYRSDETGDGGDMYDFVDRLLNNAAYMDLTFDVVSTYLFNDALGSDPPPNIDTYITANATKDYVVEGTAIWNNIVVAKTHLYTTDKNPVTEVSFKDLMDLLKIKLRAWWFIDEDGKFRIEHEYYFTDFATQLDVTALTDKPEIDRLNYLYDKGNIFSSLNYTENNELTEDFIAFPIIYDAEKTTPNNNDVNIILSTDVKNLGDNPGSADNTGLAFLQCDLIAGNKMVSFSESEFSAGVFYPNQRFSWAYLFVNYWGYFGEADSADINDGDALTLDTVKRFLTQDGIGFSYTGELLWYKPVTLDNGLAWLTEWSETEDEFLTINVGFDPYL